MNKVGLIIRREYLTRVKKRSFLVMTILGPVLFVAFMGGAMYLSINDAKTYDVVLTDQDGMLGNEIFKSDFENSKQVHYHLKSGEMSDQEFKDSPYDLKIDLKADLTYMKSINMFYKEQPGIRVTEQISNKLERVYQRIRLSKENIDRAKYESLTMPIAIKLYDIENLSKENSDSGVGAGLGFASAIMIFVFVLIYGQQIMRGVMEEKTSRIVEVLVSSVKPVQLMMGKIIGVALVGLTQFVLWIVLSTALMSAAQVYFGDAYVDPSVMVEQQMTKEMSAEMAANLGEQNSGYMEMMTMIHQIDFTFLIGMFLFYFLGGYLLYGSLYAAIGAAMDGDTDTQQFMIPIMMPLMFAYIISATIFENPSSELLYWCSIIPFTSPVVMMVRSGGMAMGYEAIDWLSIGISMALLVITFFITTWLAARIYRVGILMYGKKLSYKELWKWLRYY